LIELNDADAANVNAGDLLAQEMSCGEVADYAAWCFQQAAATCCDATPRTVPDADGDADEGGVSAYHMLGDAALRACLSRDFLILLADESLDRVFSFLMQVLLFRRLPASS
jgi:hypothetical protein